LRGDRFEGQMQDGTIPANRIEGISGGEVGVRPPSLSVSPVWPHGAFHNSGAIPFVRGSL
jgi:hypothetical protein